MGWRNGGFLLLIIFFINFLPILFAQSCDAPYECMSSSTCSIHGGTDEGTDCSPPQTVCCNACGNGQCDLREDIDNCPIDCSSIQNGQIVTSSYSTSCTIYEAARACGKTCSNTGSMSTNQCTRSITLTTVSVDDEGEVKTNGVLKWSSYSCSCNCASETGSNCAGTRTVNVNIPFTRGTSVSTYVYAKNDCKAGPSYGTWGGITANFELKRAQCNSGYTCSAGNCVAIVVCGNGICETGENYSSCPQDCPQPILCGDGQIGGGEQCDDSNTANNDGCSSLCTIESGWSCTGSPSVCNPICGDGMIKGTEQCDNGGSNTNTPCVPNYGGSCNYCDTSCVNHTVQGPYCGDGIKNGLEQCDDGNTMSGDGCSSTCQTEAPTCTLNSASWNVNETVEGHVVDLKVTTTNCQGLELSFVVKERDFLGTDDPVNINPANVLIASDGTAVSHWTAEWQAEGWPESDPPEYYFKATLVSTGANIESSNELKVYQQYLCENVVTCSDYGNQQDCENDICVIANMSVPSYVNCGNSSTDCFCSWDTTTTNCTSSVTYTDLFPPPGSDIGTCYYTENTADTCEDDGYLTVDLIATWVWDSGCNASCQTENQGVASSCQSTTEVFQCPAQIPLPIFGFYNLLAALVLIAVIYWAISLRKKGKK